MATEKEPLSTAFDKAESNIVHFIFGYSLVASEGKPETLRRIAEDYRTQLLCQEHESLLTQLGKDTSLASPTNRLIWKSIDREAARNKLHQDLLPAVDRLLHGGESDAQHPKAPFAGMAPLQLELGILPERLLLKLGNAARARLERQGIDAETVDRLGASFDEIQLYMFASGKILLDISLKFVDLGSQDTTLALPLVEESLYSLGHAADRGQKLRAVTVDFRACTEDLKAGDMVVKEAKNGFAVRRATDAEIAHPALDGPLKPQRLGLPMRTDQGKQLALYESTFGEFGLQELARALVGLAPSDLGQTTSSPREKEHHQLLRELGPDAHGRVFSFTAVQCASTVSQGDIQTAVYRLSRRFNTDYALDQHDINSSVVATFSNVLHAISTQGAAVVARETDATFIRHFLTTAVVPTYLPLALLAYHEYLHLLHLTQGCAFIPNAGTPDVDKERIQGLRYELAKFRLYFRYSHVSDIAHHNRIHRTWRETLDLDRMLVELAADVREADMVLERHHREVLAKRWRIGGAIAGFTAAFIAIHEILEALYKLSYPEHKWMLLMMKGDGATWSKIAADPRYEAVLAFYRESHHIEIWLLVSSILIAVIAGVVAYLKGPRLEE